MKVKLLYDNSKMPTKAHDTDACFDLYARLDKAGYGANRRDTRKRVYELRYADNGDIIIYGRRFFINNLFIHS